MEYFNIYKKRVNKYGTTHQDRIQGKKEHDFEVFMTKSPNLVRARDGEDGEFYKAVLQTKEYDQDEVTDYLLVPLSKKIPMGTIIYTEDSRHTEVFYEEKPYSARRWINYAVDPYTSTGYNRYTVVELESELSWVLDGIKYTSFAHATGGGSGARDKNINLKFKTQFSEAGVYLPNKRYSIVMPTHPALKKNMKITLGGETWRVAGFDSISVKGVSYVTLEETLKDTVDDAEIANYGELHNWTVTTSRGDNFTLASGEKIKLLFFYKNEEKMPNFTINAPKIVKNEVEVSSAFEIEKLGDNFIQISTNDTNYPINTHLIIHIEGWEGKDYLSVPFSIVKKEDVKKSTISGAKEFYVGDTVVLTVNGAEDEDFRTLALENNTATIIEKDSAARTIKLKGLSIGKNRLYSASGTFSYPFEVLSIWLGGK